MFLNKQYQSYHHIPSIRILSTPSINFSNISEWNEKHEFFLEYLKMERFFSVNTGTIIAVESDKIFHTSNITKGITLLYSENYIPEQNYQDKLSRLFGNSKLYCDELVDYFLPLYWSNFNIYYQLKTWRSKINKLLKESKINFSLEEMEKRVIQTIDLYTEFTLYNNEEQTNIRIARQTFNRNKNLVGPFTIHLYKLDLFKSISNIIENSFTEEEIVIKNIQNQIDVLITHYRDRSNIKLSFTNLDLQKQIKLFSIILPIISIAIPIIGYIATPFIKQFFGLQ
jgi:hypothetical protein